MKLAICPNWAEIFFDATTRRQVPFSAESALGGTTHQLQKYGRIGIANATAVSNAKTNGYFH
jgi:hypothetical protein